ncbi:hypothetical protein CARUB_v10015037mg [Capsella rubella]|uniref:Uncharacterized protein n=1 Tax=Capsella rubella TaxID=81985 RepID=R0HPW3_9BRAS|nr:hypothetical protein CARUB_v10015037mg [Capsella rubella]
MLVKLFFLRIKIKNLYVVITWISRGWPWIPIRRSIIQEPSVTNRVGNISNPSAKHRLKKLQNTDQNQLVQHDL